MSTTKDTQRRKQTAQFHMRLSEELYALVQDRARRDKVPANSVIAEILNEALSTPCPICHGTGRLAPLNQQEDPAPLATAGVVTAQEESDHEQQHQPT